MDSELEFSSSFQEGIGGGTEKALFVFASDDALGGEYLGEIFDGALNSGGVVEAGVLNSDGVVLLNDNANGDDDSNSDSLGLKPRPLLTEA